MNKLSSFLKVLFHITNFLFILLYLYPGSIFGYFLYGNIKKQPQITDDFFYISSNHLYAFIILSILGILSYHGNKKVFLTIKYLFFISILLELFHILIPNRDFELNDLFGNILGVTIISVIYKILNKIYV